MEQGFLQICKESPTTEHGVTAPRAPVMFGLGSGSGLLMYSSSRVPETQRVDLEGLRLEPSEELEGPLY